MYIPYKRVRLPFSRQGKRLAGKKMQGVWVTEVLILKLKPQARVTAALLGKQFRIKRINDPLVHTAFTHTNHIGFIDHAVFNFRSGNDKLEELWQIAVAKCERWNGERLPEYLRSSKDNIIDEFSN